MKQKFKMLLLCIALCLSNTLFAAPSGKLELISLDSLLICNGMLIKEDTAATLVLTDKELEGTGISLGGGTISVPMRKTWLEDRYPTTKDRRGSGLYYSSLMTSNPMEVIRNEWKDHIDNFYNFLIFEDVKLTSDKRCKITLQGYKRFSNRYFYIVCMGENILEVPFEKVPSPHESSVLEGKMENLIISSIIPKDLAREDFLGDGDNIQINIVPEKHQHYLGTYPAETPINTKYGVTGSIYGDHYFFEGSLTIKTSEDYPALTSSADVSFITSITLESANKAIQAPNAVYTEENTGYSFIFDEKTTHSTNVKKSNYSWEPGKTHYKLIQELNAPTITRISFECVFDTTAPNTSYLTFLDRDGSVLKIDTIHDIDEGYGTYRPTATSFFTPDIDGVFFGWEYGDLLFTEKDNNVAVFDQKNSVFKAKYMKTPYTYISRVKHAGEEWEDISVEDSVTTIDLFWKAPLIEGDEVIDYRKDSVKISLLVDGAPQDSMACFMFTRRNLYNGIPDGMWQEWTSQSKWSMSNNGFSKAGTFTLPIPKANILAVECRFAVCTWNKNGLNNKFDTLAFSSPVQLVSNYPILFEQTEDNEYYYARNPKDINNIEESEWILADSETPCHMRAGDQFALRFENNKSGKCFEDFYMTDTFNMAYNFHSLGNTFEGQAMPFGITPTYKESAEILFNDNKGEEIATIATNCDDPIELPNAPSVKGMKFIGWGTNKDDATSIVDLTSTTPSQNSVFYAIYETTTEVSDVMADEQSARKMIDEEKQQIIILQPDGRKFNVLGIELK